MKSWEEAEEKQEILWERLRRVGKRGGHTTPVVSFWRGNESGVSADPPTGGGGGEQAAHDSGNLNGQVPFRFISSRKLAAALWELHQYKLPLDNMHHGVTVPPLRLRRLNHHHHLRRDPPPSSPDLPESSSNLRRRVAKSLTQHHRSIEKSPHAMPTVSPPSYGSSMEITPYKPAVTHSSSIELKGRTGEASNCLRTSTELLKILNRIWSLEEQHVSNKSLIKALKKELHRARSQTKEIVREQQADRHEMDELMKRITEDKLVRKDKEQDRIDAAVQSMRDELENERKLRLRSESLHRKLACELYEAKASLASFSKELEREKRSRDLLEDLCDEFAWGIRDYEKELHGQKSDKDWGERADHHQLILHISESWLHGQMQAKLQPGHRAGEKKLTIDKVSSEIEAFLQSKRKISGNQALRNPVFRRSSLESIPLNVGASAPRDEDDGDDTAVSGSNRFELVKTSESKSKSQGKKLQENLYEGTRKQKLVKKKVECLDRTRELSPSSLQVKFEEHMVEAMSYAVNRNQVEDAEQITIGQGEISVSHKTEKFEAAKDDVSEENTRLNSNYKIENLIRNYYSLSESGMQLSNDHGVASSIWRSYPSPVREWTEKLPPQDLDVSETSSKCPHELEENNLKAKLFEARTRSQRSRSSKKASIIPSRDE